MARRSKAEIALEKAVDASIKSQIDGVQFDIFDLQKLTDAGTAAAKAGQDIDAAVAEAVTKYRKN